MWKIALTSIHDAPRKIQAILPIVEELDIQGHQLTFWFEAHFALSEE